MESNKWSIQDSLNTYQINKWGDGFFDINSCGELSVTPDKKETPSIISIKDVIDEAKKENISFPAVFRFHDILRYQVKNLNNLFDSTIQTANFTGKFYGVFPIKVNQLREVVEEITDVAKDYNYGLEAGSKAELMAVLAYNNNQNSLTVLNGFKDDEYLKLALLGTMMKRNIIIVIEKFSEIKRVIKIAEELGVEPQVGVRAKLTSKASGLWSDSSGDFAKFGLSITEILEMVNLLKDQDKLHWLKLLHFHVGSQIPDIRTIKDCITEATRIYVDLIKIGTTIEFLDVGGGVGIDYDGSKSSNPSSTNYSMKDYVGDVIYIIRDICDLDNIPHPNIVSETGRAIAAHHSCVITNVFGKINLTKNKQLPSLIDENEHLFIRKIKSLNAELNLTNYQDIYNDAWIIKDETVSAYKLGMLDMKERSIIESIYWSICHKILDLTSHEKDVPAEIKKLKTTLADKYLCNFSLFQSAPDSWAIKQILPIVPILKLDTKPTTECTLVDITCDSDGKIDKFLGENGQRNTLALHPISDDEEYYIGVFLTGAYQDTMGDMHNLFGRLNEVHVYSDNSDSKNFYIEEIIKGNSSAQVLEIMQYSATEMTRKVKSVIDREIRHGNIKPRIGVKLNDFYESTLNSYTYLNN